MCRGRRLQLPEKIKTIQASAKRKQLENLNGKKNNCMYISSDKQAKTPTRIFAKRKTETLLIAAQNNVISTNNVKARTDPTCNIMDEGFRFMPLGLVRLRTFRHMV